MLSDRRKEQLKRSYKKWCIKYPERRRAIMLRYYQANKEKLVEYAKQRYLRNKKFIDNRCKIYSKTRNAKDKRLIFIKNNRVVFNAYKAVHRAIKSGKLIKLPCEKCNDTKSQAHHHDYRKQLEVRWLCRQHHKELHNEIRKFHAPINSGLRSFS